jgi:hypothetical protein
MSDIKQMIDEVVSLKIVRGEMFTVFDVFHDIKRLGYDGSYYTCRENVKVNPTLQDELEFGTYESGVATFTGRNGRNPIVYFPHGRRAEEYRKQPDPDAVAEPEPNLQPFVQVSLVPPPGWGNDEFTMPYDNFGIHIAPDGVATQMAPPTTEAKWHPCEVKGHYSIGFGRPSGGDLVIPAEIASQIHEGGCSSFVAVFRNDTLYLTLATASFLTDAHFFPGQRNGDHVKIPGAFLEKFRYGTASSYHVEVVADLHSPYLKISKEN